MAAQLPEGEPAPGDGALLPIALSSTSPFSAYVHVPFCRVRCGYCDFNTYTSDELGSVRRDDYANHVAHEIALAGRVVGVRELATVFFGGGTPTLLSPTTLGQILDTLGQTFGIASDAEVTVEANPDSVDSAALVELRKIGVTRVSFGVQSAVEHVLATLDRTHDSRRVADVVRAAKDAGLDVSVDLIYGTPGESLDDWKRTLDFAIELETGHISAYALIVEEGTALERRIRRGELADIDDDLVAEMYELADQRFEHAGLSWYEVSNWSRSDAEQSRHNRAYWRNDNWWGFGPGAHSHVGGVRWWNVKHPRAYADRLTAGLSPAAARETPNEAERQLEQILLGMRMRDGIPITTLSSRALAKARELVTEGLLDPHAFAEASPHGRLVLTLRGRLLADFVIRQLTD